MPRVKIATDLDTAASALRVLDDELKQRLELFARQGAKDIDAYNQRVSKEKAIGRHVVVIDEASELFLGSGRQREAQQAVSKIARQGRAVGLHLLIGTQRPDARALDTQIKANLPGKVCFQMADNSSSMVVLGNGKAKSLPSIAGRAIWQSGLANVELQTPFLSPEEADGYLKPFRTESEGVKASASRAPNDADAAQSQGW